MSSRVFVPFDNNPLAVSVKTASYTIPTGRFAKVYVECDSGGQFTINGAVAVKTDAFINIDIAGGNNLTYTVPSGYYAIFASAGGTQTGSAYFNGNISSDYGVSAGSSALVQGTSVGPGGSITVLLNSGFSEIAGTAIPSNATHRQAEFFLPAGTIISGSGNWKAVVMEYNAIS